MNGKHSMKLTLAVAMVGGALAASTAFSQYSSPTAPSAQPSATGTTPSPTAQPPAAGTAPPPSPPSSTSMTPRKSEMSSSAFTKLDASKRGYVTKAEVAQLQGFDSAFDQADTNHDGKLSKDEFDRAWKIYSGQKESSDSHRVALPRRPLPRGSEKAGSDLRLFTFPWAQLTPGRGR